MHELTILTGASRGLGLAMARQLISPGRVLLCLSRHTREDLDDRVQAQGTTVQQWGIDLSDGPGAAARLAQWLSQLNARGVTGATLINNAGMIPRIGQWNDCPPAELTGALRLGLEAPMLLTGAFLRVTGAWVDAGWRGPRKVLNVSSGLGRRAMAAQAPYCAAKAGLDHFTRCSALDEAQRPHGARLVSLAPGVIDTDMQAHVARGRSAIIPGPATLRAAPATGPAQPPGGSGRPGVGLSRPPRFRTGAMCAVDAVRCRRPTPQGPCKRPALTMGVLNTVSTRPGRSPNATEWR